MTSRSGRCASASISGTPAVYRVAVAAAVKMIKVDERTHARLAELAAEQGITIGALVSNLAEAQRTHAEWVAIERQTRDYLREHLGYDPTPDERTALEAEHAAIMTELDRQFTVRRQARRATA
jgi:hypothetical protein